MANWQLHFQSLWNSYLLANLQLSIHGKSRLWLAIKIISLKTFLSRIHRKCWVSFWRICMRMLIRLLLNLIFSIRIVRIGRMKRWQLNFGKFLSRENRVCLLIFFMDIRYDWQRSKSIVFRGPNKFSNKIKKILNNTKLVPNATSTMPDRFLSEVFKLCKLVVCLITFWKICWSCL